MTPWEFARRYAEKPERLVVGLMSGTSVDGVDAALVRVSGSGRGTRAAVESFVTHPYPSELRETVLAVSHGEGDPATVSRLNVAVGALFADAVRELLETAGVAKADVDLVASHGQTVSHTPDPSPGGAAGATLQVGDPAVLAVWLGLPVVSNFRAADVAAGGQGAPLVPYADWCLLTDPERPRAVQNIGGIGNVTYLPADADPERVIGFDTGPGNMLIDLAASWATFGRQSFDDDGRLAAAGSVRTDVLEWLLEHPYLHQRPPKSCGREEFGAPMFERLVARLPRLPEARSLGLARQLLFGSLEVHPDRGEEPHTFTQRERLDIVATMTAFTALSIADAYERFLPAMPGEVIVGGGGARNPVLMRMLAEKLAPIPVRTADAVGINSDSKEALAFAVLANETMLGNPSNLPSVTGASRPVILGSVTLPPP
jgi:anhydro-N-acetylmuramic acid kinase